MDHVVSHKEIYPHIGLKDKRYGSFQWNTGLYRPKLSQSISFYISQKKRREFRNFGETFLKISYKTLDEMWNALRASITSAIERHVPTKLTSNIHTHPWMNTNLRKKTLRKQRAHQMARKTQHPNDWAYYKALQAEVQQETRIAHRNYI